MKPLFNAGIFIAVALASFTLGCLVKEKSIKEQYDQKHWQCYKQVFAQNSDRMVIQMKVFYDKTLIDRLTDNEVDAYLSYLELKCLEEKL